MKKQKKQKMEDKNEKRGRDEIMALPFTFSMIGIVCYFFPSTELNSSKKLVTNTYTVPPSQMKEEVNKQGTNLNFLVKYMNVI